MVAFCQLRNGATLLHRTSYGGRDRPQTPVETLVDWGRGCVGDSAAACLAGGGERMVLAPSDPPEGQRVGSRRHPL